MEKTETHAFTLIKEELLPKKDALIKVDPPRRK